MITGVEDVGEIRTVERKGISYGATLMATHTYMRNPESNLGKEIDSDATKKGQENSTEETHIRGWIGQEGERRNSYSAAGIDGIKRNSWILV